MYKVSLSLGNMRNFKLSQSRRKLLILCIVADQDVKLYLLTQSILTIFSQSDLATWNTIIAFSKLLQIVGYCYIHVLFSRMQLIRAINFWFYYPKYFG